MNSFARYTSGVVSGKPGKFGWLYSSSERRFGVAVTFTLAVPFA